MTLDPKLAGLPNAIWEKTPEGPTLLVHFGLPSRPDYLDNLQRMLDPCSPADFHEESLRDDLLTLTWKLERAAGCAYS